jgi:predicted permease
VNGGQARGGARRVYRLLLRFGPPALVARHRDEMEALFLDTLVEARARGPLAVLSTWIRAAFDIAASNVTQSLRRRSRPPAHPPERQALMIGSDLRYTVRWLGRQKFSTSLVVAMLSLGIAATTVVFSLVNALFLRPFPFDAPDRLVYLNETAPRWNLEVVGINYPDFHQWRQAATVFEGMAMWDGSSFNLSDASGAERIEGARVTHDLAAVLRVKPLLGRMFSADEDKPGAPPVVVIGEGLWRERFGARQTVLGETLRLNGVAHPIVGVMPAAASFPRNIRLWVPFQGNPAQDYQSYGSDGAIARLKPGVSAEDAAKELLRTQQPIWEARDRDKLVSPFVRPLREQFVRDFRAQASTLEAAVAILMIVACANVASVMLARAIARRREMGIRLAIGASRTRLARQLFLENLLLASAGGAAGLVLGRWALQLLLTTAGDQVPQWADFSIDSRIVAFTVLLSSATAILFGWAPALHAIRSSVRNAMHDVSSGMTSGPAGRRTLALLVGAEFALAAVLLVCAGLLLRAYDRVRQVDPGFDARNVLTFSVSLPEAVYGSQNDAKALAFWNRLIERLQSQPGVEAAGVVSCVPLGCHWGTFYNVEGAAPRAAGEAHPVTLYRPASPGYFQTMGIRLKSGRFFTPDDGKEGHPVVIVNETFARTFWPGVSDPVGRRLRGTGDDSPWITVVGFVSDVKHYGLERPMRPGVYFPLRQTPARTLTVAVRTATDAASFTGTARAAVREMDPDLAMYGIRTMEDALERSLAERTLYSWLIAVFAAMTLILALGGTYGVLSYLVSQRTRELGIRVALGAQRGDITREVLWSSLVATAGGVAIGVVSAIFVARMMAELLFGVPPHDVTVLAFSAVTLIVVASLVNWFPASRAARVDPMRFLRVE